MNSQFRTSIIGGGKVGLSIADYLFSEGLLCQLLIKEPFKLDYLHLPCINNINDLEDSFNILIIAVNDINIESVVESLMNINLKEKIVVHTSGSKSVSVLERLLSVGAVIGSIHPYQTFYKNDKDLLIDCPWGIECRKEDKLYFQTFIENILKGKSIFLNFESPQDKILYHISACIASNYIATTLNLAINIAKSLNLEPEILIKRILLQTISNTFANIDDTVATGPIARGDIDTLEKQFLSLNDNENLSLPFKYLSLSAIEIAYSNNTISEVDYTKFKNIFDNKDDNKN